MQPASVRDQGIDFPLARIDSADETFSRPFREFLEDYGTRVFVNKVPPVKPDYHLVVGDPEFVKYFFAAHKRDGSKSLVLIYAGILVDAKWVERETGTKVVLLDASLPDSRQVSACFAFLFTASEKILDLRTRKIDESPQDSLKQPVVAEDSETHERQRIQESIDSIFKKSADQPRSVVPKTTSRRREKRLLRFLFIPLIIFASLITPLLWYVTSLLLGLALVYFGSVQMSRGNVGVGEQAGKAAEAWIRQGKAVLQLISFPFSVAGASWTIRVQEQTLSLLDNVAGSLVSLAQVTQKGKTVAALLLTQVARTPGTTETPSVQSPAIAVRQLQEDLLVVENKLSFAKAELAALLTAKAFPFSLGEIQTLAIAGQTKLGKLAQNMFYLNNFLTLYPDLAGFGEKKTYLVLFQNSMELRPTGGFIGSLATATFEQGRLVDLNIQDVYTVDGQLKGHVDPPIPIREQLNEEHWYLRDSNWDPDFSRAGARAAWFYEKETGTSVDGVVAISSPFLVDLLAATGPLELPDYNDRITAENFFGKSLFYTQTNFFPGSTQKKDFLGSLVNALVFKITAQGSPNPKLFTAVSSALDRGDILLMFKNPEEQAIVERFGWAGRLALPGRCSPPDQNCFSDTLAVVDANLGVNKVNYYIQRYQQNLITFAEDGKAETTIAVTYRNTSASSEPSAGAGLYKVYTRFILPADAALTSATIDSVNLPSRDPKKPAPVMPYREEDATLVGARAIGVAFEVKPTSERRLTVTYRRGSSLELGSTGGLYDLVVSQQPGLINALSQTSLTFPIYWTPKQIKGEGTVSFLAKQGRLEYNSFVSKTQEIKVKFVK